tara:strand:- start:2376 stop:2603 length:228 start_codon:yes stop_codon:yes gene_type:complete
MITTYNIDLGFRFKTFTTIYEVVGILNFNNDVMLINTETGNTFNFSMSGLIRGFNAGDYKIEPKAKLKLTYIEEL